MILTPEIIKKYAALGGLETSEEEEEFLGAIQDLRDELEGSVPDEAPAPAGWNAQRYEFVISLLNLIIEDAQ